MNIGHMNIIEQERDLKHKIRQERCPRARKHLVKRLRALRNVKAPSLKIVD